MSLDTKPVCDDLQQRVAEIWLEVLPVETLDADDDFFDLGGNSLMAAHIVYAIERDLGIRLALSRFIEAPTVALLADAIRTNNEQAEFRSLVALQPQGDKPALFLVPPAASSAMHLKALAGHLGLEHPVYGFEPTGMDGLSAPHSCVDEMAAHYVAELRDRQAAGPYHLGGLCMGGIVALEMAQQLIAQGQSVGLLAVIESGLPRRFMLRHRNPLIRWLIKTYQESVIGIRRCLMRLRASVGGNANSPAEVQDGNGVAPKEVHADRYANLLRLHIRARKEYMPYEYPGTITYFRATGQAERKAWIKGWTELAGDKFDLVDIPGNHITLFEQPSIQVLATQILGRLDPKLEAES